MMVLVDYARARLMRPPVLAAVLLVTASAHVARGFSTVTILIQDFAIALSLVAAFRVWDDVMDRESDRVRHPERPAVAARSVPALLLMASCIALAGTGALLGVHGVASVALVIAFTGVLAAWYAVRGARSAAGDRILLFKYAIFTFALSGPAPFTPRTAAVALGVYLAACLYEWRHDPDSPVFSVGGSR